MKKPVIPKLQHEQDIFNLLKNNGILEGRSWNIFWDWAIAELNQIIHQREYYKKKYDEMKKILG